jgi:hypothetical protein
MADIARNPISTDAAAARASGEEAENVASLQLCALGVLLDLGPSSGRDAPPRDQDLAQAVSRLHDLQCLADQRNREE